MAGWRSTSESLQGLLNNVAEQQKQKREMKQALQLMMLKSQMQQQAQQQNPANQLNQLRLAQALQGLQQQGQFNRQADIGFGEARSTPQEMLPVVPQNLQQRFMQTPVGPPGLREALASKIRQPYEQAGVSLIPGIKGWERVKNEKRGAMGTTTDDEIQSATQGIISGNVPPNISQTTSFRDRTRVAAALEKSGFNLSQANSEWNATQKFLSSMNSEKQVRLRQAITSVKDALGGLEQLNNEMVRSNFAPLNKAQLAIQANSGNALATKFLGQINIIQDELGQVFMGGNSPTERALELAINTLKGNWSQKQLQVAIDNVRTNLGYRENAINYAGVQGATQQGGGTRYLPPRNNPMELQQPTKENRIGKYTFQ